MVTIVYIEAISVCLAICLVMLLTLTLKIGNIFREYKIVITLISLVIAALSFDIIYVICNCQNSAASFVVSKISVSLNLVVNNTLPVTWFLYCYMQIYKKYNKHVFAVLIIPYIISLFLILANAFSDCLFTVGYNLSLSKGSLYFLNVALDYFYVFCVTLILAFNRQKLGSKRFKSLLIPMLPPFIGSLVQDTFGGVGFVWCCGVISLLFVYLDILRDKINVDYLSGLFNRMQADEYLDSKIRHSTKDRSFSGVMIDVDNFKSINDTYGHAEGDKAIEKVASILKRNVSKKDFVARQGGDEFLVILETGSLSELLKTSEKLDRAFQNYNKSGKCPYEITISMGFDVYNCRSGMSRKQFMHHIDELMYINKRNKKIKKQHEKERLEQLAEVNAETENITSESNLNVKQIKKEN